MLVVLLVISSGAALLAPTREEPEPPPPVERAKPPGEQKPRTAGKLVHARLDAGPPHRETIVLRRGDQLGLVVRSGGFDQVEIRAFGVLEDVAGEDPARVDLLADREGTFPIRLIEARQTIGRIEVRGPRDGKRISREARRE